MSYCLKCGAPAEYKIPDGDNRERLICSNCGYIHYENPKNIVGALVTNDKGEVLLCKRAIEPRYGLWTLPAGFMEGGETLEEGAARETREEACAEIEVGPLLCAVSIPFIPQVYVIFMGTLPDGKHAAGPESLETAWFKPEDIPWEQLAFPVITQALQYWLDGGQPGATWSIEFKSKGKNPPWPDRQAPNS
ncbi:MAG: NUDIX hydrolase [Gammaproteobacteria bacterium]|nr:NUDIX hydrolase [Gammaproteobacteria bacterium]